MFLKIKLFFLRLIPRYQLSYDNKYFNVKDKNIKYRFKSFGDHSFPEFSFKEIKYNEDVLFAVNPYDLIKITEINSNYEYLKNQLKIDEILRNNLYKLSNEIDSNIFSGDEICENPLLIDQIVKSDLFKIAYNTGFNRGRKLSKIITPEDVCTRDEKNIVKLKCIINKKFNS